MESGFEIYLFQQCLARCRYLSYYRGCADSRFLKTYQTKSDEEIVQLAAAPDQLTSEARFALQSELSRRHINIAEKAEGSQADTHQPSVGLVSAEERGQSLDRQNVTD